MREIQYLKAKSGTLLWGIKCVACVLAVYVSYCICKEIYPVIREIRAADVEFNEAQISFWTEILKSFGFGIENLKLKASDIALLSSWSVVLLYFLLYPLIVIAEGVAATAVRFMQKGVWVILGTQFFSMIVWLGFLIISFFGIYQVNFSGNEWPEEIVVILNIVLGISVINDLLSFCYHKDIVRILLTVKENIEGKQGKLKKTHLSGISVLMGVGTLLIFLAGVYYTTNASSDNLLYLIITDAIIAGHAVKMFSVAACNRQVKNYNRQ